MRMLKRLRRQYRWKLRISMWGMCAMLLLLALTGCGGNDPHKPRANSYGHDGYLGASNSNPNLPNNFSYLSIGSDSKLVRQVLEPVDGIKDVRLNFNGSRLHVDVIADADVPDSEMGRLQEQVQKIVQFNMPRYRVHVDVSK